MYVYVFVRVHVFVCMCIIFVHVHQNKSNCQIDFKIMLKVDYRYCIQNTTDTYSHYFSYLFLFY